MIWRLIGMLQGEMSEQDMSALMVEFAAVSVVLLLCLPLHEYAHGWMAKKLGDDTAWLHGRLTLNPAKHLDLFGTLMILFIGFGYAKPVPVNPRNFKNGKYKKGMALTAAAGPLSNLMLAVIFCLASQLSYMAFLSTGSEVLNLIWLLLGIVSFRNIALAVFNLIPFPPLDGSRILDLVLPYKASRFIAMHENIFRWAVILLIFLGTPIFSVALFIFRGLTSLVGLPFSVQLPVWNIVSN